MKYMHSTEGLTEQMLNGFFVDWPNPPNCATHLKLLKRSYKAIVAVNEEEDQVVGFITAISDGILSAYIPLLEVLPEYKQQGIGKELLHRMMKELDGIYMIDLMCDAELQSFYEKVGMAKSNGMILRNRENQSG
ncbi:GNAT family N-acetyltransferase [Cytobacillus purgationiresistens]|uniref:Ribosomal protein S18 acetylase RimI-like enzyme n=1 Tax=Cytobacillus purgationiresistens TaxID=863449 RepID=A0ABU0AM67_9BACI|nr:GNAT family N-acetyltransferase [Cytobacillus purgationiresistens]MDQ0272327.1 ribosomal protein S18 acetylase RimI-like enzyme [Cytobacillus purgationiresistens]